MCPCSSRSPVLVKRRKERFVARNSPGNVRHPAAAGARHIGGNMAATRVNTGSAADKEEASARLACSLAFSNWWAHWDSNPGPKDSAWCDFRHSLDFAFTVSCDLGGCRQVSTPSATGETGHYLHVTLHCPAAAWLGVAMCPGCPETFRFRRI